MTLSKTYTLILLTAFLTIISINAYAQNADKKIKMPGGADVKAAIDKTTAESKTKKGKPGYEIVDMSLNYDAYQKRLKTYLKPLEDSEDWALKDSKDYEKKRKKAQKELDATKKAYRNLETKLRKARMDDQKEELITQLEKEFEETKDKIKMLSADVRISKQLDKESMDKWLKYSGMYNRIEELSDFKKDEKVVGRPTLEQIIVKTETKDILRADLKFQPHVIKNFESHIKFLNEVVADSQEEVLDFDKKIERATKKRDSLVSTLGFYNKKVQKSYVALTKSIRTEEYARGAFQIITDVAEIIIEGKNPAGAAAEALVKFGEAYFISGLGKGYSMYSPDKLVGEFSSKEGKYTFHFDDPYTTNIGSTMQGQAGRTLSTIVGGLIVRADTAADYRAAKQLQDTIRERLANSIQTSKNLVGSTKGSMKLSENVMTDLLQEHVKVAEELGKSTTKGAEKTALKAQRRAIRKHLAAEAASRTLRRTYVEAAEESIEEMTKDLAKKTAEQAFGKRYAKFAKVSVKKIGKSVGHGLTWDALRGSVHTLMDSISEREWIIFLDECFTANIVGKQARYMNDMLAALRRDRTPAINDLRTNQAMLAHTNYLYKSYKSKVLGDEGMHVLLVNSAPSTDKKLKVSIKTHSATHGEDVYLKGNLQTVKLIFDNEFETDAPEYPITNTEIVEMELTPLWKKQEEAEKYKDKVGWRDFKNFDYKLPDNIPLETISNDGKLKLEIRIR